MTCGVVANGYGDDADAALENGALLMLIIQLAPKDGRRIVGDIDCLDDVDYVAR